VLLLRHIPKFNLAVIASKHLLEIERVIARLSVREKLWLLEQIARQLREPDEAELSEMANDPEIQSEITVWVGKMSDHSSPTTCVDRD
jgi:hypothetical protein